MRFCIAYPSSQAWTNQEISTCSRRLTVNRMVINRLPANSTVSPLTNQNASEYRVLIQPLDSASLIVDVVDDLLELKYLIGNLQKNVNLITESDTSDCARLFTKTISDLVKDQKTELQNHLDTVERISGWNNSSDIGSVLNKIRIEFIEMKSYIREGFKLLGALMSSADWQSPIYRSSFSPSANRLTENIKEHVLDYKRDGHLEASEYEESFVREYMSHLGSRNLKAYLTNSGMAAFTTVLHWITGELKLSSSCLAVTPMYFENIHLAEAFFPKLDCVSPSNASELKAKLKQLNPQVVLVDAITNCGEVKLQNYETIIEWARTTRKKTVVVIDTTCIPVFLLPDNLLADLPEHVSVVIVESLAKHHQFGMDTVTGGVVVIDGVQSTHKNFRPTRARFGTNITDASAQSLPSPNRQRLSRRLKRHSRNMEILAQCLYEQIEQHSGIIDSISWVGAGPENNSWYRSPVMSISLCPQFQSVWHYQEFERRVYEIALERKHPVAFSTSFGFDVSRFYVTAPSTDFEPPFLRLSIGTETLSQLKTLIEIMNTASEQLAGTWTMRDKVVPVHIKPVRFPQNKVILPEAQAPEKNYTGVFAGENSLKDYLNPANFAPTPLVELPTDMNPYAADGVKIFAKFMPMVPLMNIKSLPAFSMLNEAYERGDLDGVKNIIESSSSNTVMSLSIIAKVFGIDTTCALVDHSISPGLIKMLQLFGVEIFKHPSIGHELFGKIKPRRDRAAKMGSQNGWFNPNQYANPDNPEGFAKWLAPSIWEQTEGKLSLLSCGLGTCGTMVGLSRYLRKQKEDLEIVACCPQSGQAVPGPREESLLWDVEFDWKTVYNTRVDLPAKDSFEKSMQLLRRGIMAGPSSGMNYAGLLKHLEELKSSGKLTSMKEAANTDELWSVFICCDSPLQHINDYFVELGEECFPPVHEVNKEELK